LIEKILADKEHLTGSNLSVIIKALELMESNASKEVALALAKQTEEAFRDHSETQVAIAAWQQHALREHEMEDLGMWVSEEGDSQKNPQKAKELGNALMAKIASPITAFVLIKLAIELEQEGSIEVASEFVKIASTQIENAKGDSKNELASSCEKSIKRLGVINKAMNISTLVDTEGKAIDMARYQGKVVLVDFWASWCGPCIQEIPNIEKVFAEKNSEGFEVIGVNLDQDRSKMEAFLKSKKLLWTTYVSASQEPNESGFNTPLAVETGIIAIPFVVVIGKDGNVAAIHVRGDKLAPTIAEQLAK
jgi:thiol-disulfide isomerase/thioredoxin